MGERLQEVEARARSIEGLSSIVSAMRTLAAVRLSQAQGSLPSMRAYADVLAAALADAMSLLPGGPLPARSKTVGIVLFGSEHGFVGGLVRELLAALPPGPRELYVVGTRALYVAREQNLTVDFSVPMATRAAGVAETAQRLSEEIARRYLQGRIGPAEAIFARQAHGPREIVRRRLLDPGAAPRATRSRERPMTYLPPMQLVEKVMLESFFAELAHAAMEAFASESAAGLDTLESARQAIRGKLDELRGEERRIRQEQITEQILERMILEC